MCVVVLLASSAVPTLPVLTEALARREALITHMKVARSKGTLGWTKKAAQVRPRGGGDEGACEPGSDDEQFDDEELVSPEEDDESSAESEDDGE